MDVVELNTPSMHCASTLAVMCRCAVALISREKDQDVQLQLRVRQHAVGSEEQGTCQAESSIVTMTSLPPSPKRPAVEFIGDRFVQ